MDLKKWTSIQKMFTDFFEKKMKPWNGKVCDFVFESMDWKKCS